MPDPDVLTLPELALLLRVGRKTVYTLAQDGEVPGFKVGGQWRFRRRDIEAWIDTRTRRSTATGGGAARDGEQR
jgi:excisionase family DNA binding protein